VPAGAVASPPWASGTWPDTAWEENTWGIGAVVEPEPEPGSGVSSFARPDRVPAPIELYAVLELPAFVCRGKIVVAPPPITVGARLHLSALEVYGLVDPDPVRLGAKGSGRDVTVNLPTLRARGSGIVLPAAPKGVNAKQWRAELLRAWTGKES
jgi:hypothetical protein